MEITNRMICKLLNKFRESENAEELEDVRNNREIMISLMKKDIFAYRFASLEIRSDKNLALKVLKRHGILLDSVAPELRKDRQVVLTAVSNYGYALEYASPELKDHFEIVLAAVKSQPRSLTYASARLRENMELINLAFKLGNPFIIEPKAFKCFLKIHNEACNVEKYNSKVFKRNKLYEYCLKFSDGKITGMEMLEFQHLLMKKAEELKLKEDIETEDLTF